jgi:hypothetical protein
VVSKENGIRGTRSLHLAAFLKEEKKMKSGRWKKRSSWYAVAFVLPMMMIMVSPALSGTGTWYNWYNAANTTMYWMYNGNWRLAYTYGVGQWYDCTQLGGKDNWNTLGSTGQSPNFLGNASIGSYLPVGNGWYYGYDTRSDAGYWMNSAGNFRFGYQYGSGQWWDQNLNQWNQIGAANVQSPFIGDGKPHDMKNNWSYEYLTSNDTGYWITGGTFRLAYGYTPGVWWDYSDTWRALSSTGVGSAFIGNAAIGAYYYMNNNWYYGYDVNQDIGYWKASTGPFRFAYYYPEGIWYDAANTGGWASLGSAGLSSAFLGDGSWHTVGTGLSYIYSPSSDCNSWMVNGYVRFAYVYGSGQWYDIWSHLRSSQEMAINPRDWDPSWMLLGQSGQSSAFVGDGAYHVLFSDGTRYRYSSEYGYWNTSGVPGTDDFRFGYIDGGSTGSTWLRYYDGATAYGDVRYIGNHRYFISNGIYWTTMWARSSHPTGGSGIFDEDIGCVIWDAGSKSNLAEWYIFTHGGDGKWSAGALNVVLVDSSMHPSVSSYGRYRRMVEQYAKTDVIVMEAAFSEGVTFSQILDNFSYITGYYGKTIDNLSIWNTGTSSSFNIGQDYINTSNYATTYGNYWTRLDGLMTDGGQLQFEACLVGTGAPGMLDQIASLTHTYVYANGPVFDFHWIWLNGSGYSSSTWNYNFWQVYLSDYTFEYASPGAPSYTNLFNFYM